MSALIIKNLKISSQDVRLRLLKEIFQFWEHREQNKELSASFWAALVCEPVEQKYLELLKRPTKKQCQHLRMFVFDVLESLVQEQILIKNGAGYYFRNRNYQGYEKLQSGVEVDLEVARQLILEFQSKRLFSEGSTREITQTEYERDSNARAICLALYGFDCAVCGFNFEKVFGQIGDKWIHVHHLNPISQGERITDPQKDLRPVCPNCHAMLHRRNPPFSIAELQGLKARNQHD